ncbi:hypothetical protein [Thiorhodococcus fuscus]|uniref:OmpA family protein n=1 Tax=Thiorhodococcus fuscus TaxID=527200 RepID=A0ABW4YBH5_9GAMM
MSMTNRPARSRTLFAIGYLLLTFVAGLLLVYRVDDRLGMDAEAIRPQASSQPEIAEPVAQATSTSAAAPSEDGTLVAPGDIQRKLRRLEEDVASLRRQQAESFEREHALILEELTSIAKAHQDRLNRTRALLSETQENQARLDADLAFLRARYTEEGLLVTVSGGDLEAIRASGVSERVARLADVLARNPRLRLSLRGRIDGAGSASGDRIALESAVRSVRNQLVALGGEADRIELETLGEDRPLAGGAVSEGQTRGVSVDVYFISP